MSIFERYLTVWVGLCIFAGVALGHVFAPAFHLIAAAEIAKVNLPMAALIWLMIIPMLIKVDFAALGQVARHWRGISVTLLINWLVKPFGMALLGWIFISQLFRPYLPADQIDSYIAGLILLAATAITYSLHWKPVNVIGLFVLTFMDAAASFWSVEGLAWVVGVGWAGSRNQGRKLVQMTGRGLFLLWDRLGILARWLRRRRQHADLDGAPAAQQVFGGLAAEEGVVGLAVPAP